MIFMEISTISTTFSKILMNFWQCLQYVGIFSFFLKKNLISKNSNFQQTKQSFFQNKDKQKCNDFFNFQAGNFFL